MPSLWDLLNSGDLSGAGTEFNNVIGQNRNSLVGLGLGLASGGLPAGLQGYQAGANTDVSDRYRQAQIAQHQQELAFRKAEAARQAGQWQKSFELQNMTPYQRMERDLAAATTPEGKQRVESFYRSQLTEAAPPPTREVQDPVTRQTVIHEWRGGRWQPATMPTSAAPVDPFTAGAGRPVYGQTPESYAAPAAPSTGAAGPQATPVMPPQKPLAAHEQASVEKADEAVNTNRQVIANLQYAKELSRKAASGPFALQRGQAGSMLSGTMFGEGGKETVMLHNTITANAVEQLKSIFGGNPSEGERKILLEVQGSVNASDAVRQDIYDRAIQAANARLELNQQRAAGIRGGTYYRPGGGLQAPAAAPTAGGGVRRYNPETGRIE